MRPTVHFTAASGWINDPHGISATGDGYQVFFQHVPGRMQWEPDCHWGHATGRDLLSLRENKIAIAPGDGDENDLLGCGCPDAPWDGPLRAGSGSKKRAGRGALNAHPGLTRTRTRRAAPLPGVCSAPARLLPAHGPHSGADVP